MPSLSDLHIDFLSPHIWLVVLVCLLFLTISFFYYRRTTPPLPRGLRLVLLGLRMIAVLCLFLALAQPILSLTQNIQQKKKIAVLVDRSQSMTLPFAPGNEGSRLDKAEQLIESGPLEQLLLEMDTDYFAFAESLDVNQRGANLSGAATDLSTALADLAQRALTNPYQYVLILSDGRTTRGDNLPDIADDFDFPIFTIAVGDSSRVTDLAITEILHDDVVYAGKKTQIDITVTQTGNIPNRQQLRLYDGENLLVQKTIDPPGGDKIGEYSLELTPATPGQLILDVRLGPSPEETNTENNRAKISLRVLKSRLRILMYSSSVNYEYSFIKRYLATRDDYEVESVIDAPGGQRLGIRFPSAQESLNSYDAIIFIDPNFNRINQHAERLASYLEERGGGIMVLAGPETARSAQGSPIAELLPLAISSSQVRYGQYQLVPDQRMIFHPAVKLGTSREDITATWQNQPPFSLIVPVDSLRRNGVALAYLDGNTTRGQTAMLALRRMGPGKIITASVSPFWNWAFYPLGVGGSAEPYQSFVSGTVRWLTIGDESDRINFQPTRRVFQSGEEVTFGGLVRDEGFRPIENASGTVRIFSEDGGDTTTASILSDPAGPGRYQSNAGMLRPGTYRYEARLQADDVRLGTFDGTFAVDDVNRETAMADVDWSALAQTARISGGAFAAYDNLTPVLSAISAERQTITRQREIRLWDHLILLIIILVALAVEWFIRKQRQLL